MGEQSDPAVRAAQHSFILEWGRMSSNWGINPTMAQIHALLFITGEAMSMDEIITRLHISRGNASMNLRDLMDWGVVRRFRNAGDRRDTYVADTNALTMVARVVRERKRREIDPTVEVLKSCMHMIPAGNKAGDEFRQRLGDLLSVFDLVDVAFRFAMSNEERVRWVYEHRDELRTMLEQIAPQE
jgi:DNA-binding transcriptional regulator GbsR (MarR family)